MEDGIFRVLKLLCMILLWWIEVMTHLPYTTPRVSPNVNADFS